MLLRERKIGLRAIAKCFGVSHQTIKNRLKQIDAYIKVRQFDRKHTKRNLTYNKHLIDKATHFIDAWDFSNGSISKMHHKRKRLENTPLLITLCNKERVLTYEIFTIPKENAYKYQIVVEKALEKGINIEYLVIDRYYKKLVKWLEGKEITPIIYGKDTKRPYNVEVERQFGNIAKTQYEDIEFVKLLTPEQLRDYMKGLVEIYHNYNATPMINFLISLKQEIIVTPLVSNK